MKQIVITNEIRNAIIQAVEDKGEIEFFADMIGMSKDQVKCWVTGITKWMKPESWEKLKPYISPYTRAVTYPRRQQVLNELGDNILKSAERDALKAQKDIYVTLHVAITAELEKRGVKDKETKDAIIENFLKDVSIEKALPSMVDMAISRINKKISEPMESPF